MPETWNIVKGELAQEIRRFAPKSTLLVGSNRWNHVNEFEHMTPIEDDNVIYDSPEKRVEADRAQALFREASPMSVTGVLYNRNSKRKQR